MAGISFLGGERSIHRPQCFLLQVQSCDLYRRGETSSNYQGNTNWHKVDVSARTTTLFQSLQMYSKGTEYKKAWLQAANTVCIDCKVLWPRYKGLIEDAHILPRTGGLLTWALYIDSHTASTIYNTKRSWIVKPAIMATQQKQTHSSCALCHTVIITKCHSSLTPL